MQKGPKCDLREGEIGNLGFGSIYYQIELKMDKDKNITPLCNSYWGRNFENRNLGQFSIKLSSKCNKDQYVICKKAEIGNSK